ncbi:siderophore ABC transporter substrate-binding protein [Paracoccus fistulariae]|uniref:Siderophore ABC transporter substrate-binding protein n=1 Tax=Paracoccus fistulariae TaxID=658446 RepID=A0ABY7SQ41_9RHOB|nr:siderophore ABC transporter substrate-binding protein [Paracoccus fistulariae]MDB6183080.1 siderophore ABC transporter substrate-binding protein [Paracoccus fistulariae]WCR09165.1 siderophore ABC transporter substrate-binding protein [Paracoccus fistulariae]
MKAAIFALTLALPTALHAQDIQIDTATGPVAVAPAPENLAVFDLAAIDTLNALGVTVTAGPDITPPAFLAPALADSTKVGTLFEPDFEALAAMGPDLIIAGGRSAAQVDALSRIAPTVDMTITGDALFEEAESRLTSYGTLFGKEDQAAELKAQLDTALQDARAAVANKGNALILLTNGGKVSAYGAGSRFGWLHSALNLPEARGGLDTQGSHGEAVSFEFIADTNPDWLLVLDRGAAIGEEGEAAAATLDNPLVAGTTAGQKGQIVYLDPAALYLSSGGVQSLTLLLKQVTEAFGAANS